MSLSELVKAAALESGFDLVGIAPAEPLREAEAATLERLRAGMLDGMGWITEERVRLSCDPARLLPGARSIIALGKYYPSTDWHGPARTPTDSLTDAPRAPHPAPRSPISASPLNVPSGTFKPRVPASAPTGRLARYARGLDYHDFLRPGMGRILDLVARAAGRRPAARLFVDSSPLAERAVAVEAGLGWFGHNTCLLTLHRGSWLLLAEILTDLDLEPDEPTRRDCGRCRICLDRCPTGALVAPYVLDGRRCISYLTIEHKGTIPRDLRPLMGDWIFGCDVCQEVCPWNRRPRPAENPAFAPRPGIGARPDLISLLSLDSTGFRALFRGTPLLRPKRRALLRNAAVALGNAGDRAAVPALIRALEDEEPLLRSHAAWALGRLGGSSARAALERALAREPEEAVAEEVRGGLGG